jgi:hypothetical protein
MALVAAGDETLRRIEADRLAPGRLLFFAMGMLNMQIKSEHLDCGNAPKVKVLSPWQRARICEAIRREIDLEYISRTNRKREARARVVIGLRPFPRTIHAVRR